MLKENNTHIIIQGKVLESSKNKIRGMYYIRILINEDSFQELYLKEKLKKGFIYNIKGEINSRFAFVKYPIITRIG